MILLDYIYEHLDEFKLILTCAEGTKYSDFIHQLVEKETWSSYEYMKYLREEGYEIPKLNEKLIHIVSSGFMSGFFEVVIHDMDKEEARDYVRALGLFYAAGWEKLFGIQFGH